MSASTAPQEKQATLLSENSTGDFRRYFNRHQFEFRHTLATDSLFELPSLIELNSRLPGHDYYDSGDARPGDRWDQMPARELPSSEILQRIENAKAWFFIKNAQHNRDYAAVLENCLREAEDLAGSRFRRGMRNQEMIVFVTSPNRVTQYHIDRECNFLLQVRGTKTIHVFDGNDRSILSEDEIERFWTVDNNAPGFREEFQARASSYRLTPGTGIHIPVNFPHWVQNDDNVSVSVSVNFQFDERIRGDVYRANYCLRRLGLNPTPPGISPGVDRLKASVMAPVLRARQMLRSKI